MNWWLTVPSWIVALYFGIGFVAKAGFPPKGDILIGDALSVGLTLFFIFLPFFSKIKIGSLIELEREIKEAKEETTAVKEELREFKNEVRNTVSVISTNAISQHINVHLPGADELRRQQEKVEENLKDPGRQRADDVEAELQSDDVTYALAKVRIDIERLLRTILGRRLDSSDGGISSLEQRRFQSIDKMFDMLVREETTLAYLRSPLRNVLAVCNAAMHAQTVNPEQASEALKLGAQIIAALKDYFGGKDFA
ncbi:hypothetical protein [Burkholderia sp. Ac-20353]|uniref:hypothetical protein n=1 Tax=Burkholderia sp. Ac-20353 TaxID=2703894 RepID=UPI00197B9B9E|nr:hypothetical protein [Burkholderia sp. Ac-20353]MBN3791802.1 hypothetical protein [Burkholderia sp. Ac-20353]